MVSTRPWYISHNTNESRSVTLISYVGIQLKIVAIAIIEEKRTIRLHAHPFLKLNLIENHCGLFQTKNSKGISNEVFIVEFQTLCLHKFYN